jgi:ankyrin repeat protein
MENENQAQVAAARENNLEALFNAVSEDDVSTLERLLDEGADPDTFYDDDHNISSKSILHIACGKGRTDCVKSV